MLIMYSQFSHQHVSTAVAFNFGARNFDLCFETIGNLIFEGWSLKVIGWSLSRYVNRGL